MLKQLDQGLSGITATSVGSTLPSFSAVSINGENVSSSSLASADVAIISFWATWSYGQFCHAESNTRIAIGKSWKVESA
jgi:hypothetical protein